MSKAIWRGAVLGGATGVVLSFVWSYRRDDTVDMALGRATRMGAVFAATGAVLGGVIDSRGRRSNPAPRWSVGLPAGQSVERGLETLGRAAEVARPRVEHAVEVARPGVEHAVEVARPRVVYAVEVARPRVEQALEVARVVAEGRRRGWGFRPAMFFGEAVEGGGGALPGAAKPPTMQ